VQVVRNKTLVTTMRYKVFMAEKIQVVFWIVMPCSAEVGNYTVS